jgi:MFS family permease
MLGSITPLGERGRGSRWWVTVSAYLVGSVVGGALAGGLMVALSTALGAGGWSTSERLAAIAIALIVGLALDLGLGGLRLPTIRRQVDEEWRGNYRGWVWGLAFGFQLALGVVTIVTTSTVYVTWLAAALGGSVAGGVAIGLAFGVARAVPVFAVAGVRSPGQLLGVDTTLRRLARPARSVTYAAAGALAGVAAAVAR